MARMILGEWTTEAREPPSDGRFQRATSSFRRWIRADGSSPHAPEPGRYVLWGAHNCPWAHRTIITRALMGLEDAIDLRIAHVRRSDQGWWFPEGDRRFQPEDGQLALHRLYSHSASDYTGSVTVPVLWDRRLETIVSNESAEIVRMFGKEAGSLSNGAYDLYPDVLADEIEQVNDQVYRNVNNGVYRCGFARSQEAYDEAFRALFATLDGLEVRLGNHRYLVGDTLTEADIRLFPTLVRFDAVYHGHFKCNLRRIVDYPNLWAYTRDLYQTAGFGESVRIEVYKQGYYGNSKSLNPRGIIPLGPALDFDEPHGRER